MGLEPAVLGAFFGLISRAASVLMRKPLLDEPPSAFGASVEHATVSSSPSSRRLGSMWISDARLSKAGEQIPYRLSDRFVPSTTSCHSALLYGAAPDFRYLTGVVSVAPPAARMERPDHNSAITRSSDFSAMMGTISLSLTRCIL